MAMQMHHSIPAPRRAGLLRWLGTGGAMLLLWSGGPPGASAQVTVMRTSSDVFYIDTSGDSLGAAYTSYQITNTGAAAYTEMWVEIGDFSGGVVSLAPRESNLVKIDTLVPGQTKTAFFYLLASGATASPQGHTIRVYEGRPTSGVLLTSANFSLAGVQETLSANANKVTTVVSGPNPPGLGGIVTITVSGQTGTIGSSRILSFTPASYRHWPADDYRLVSTEITLSGGNTGTLRDQLYHVASSTNSTDYTAVYRFRAAGVAVAPSVVSPVAYISSGAQIKHTDTGTFGALDPIEPTQNKVLLLSKTADPGVLSGAGTVTYTLAFQNSDTISIRLDDIVDTLPTSPATPAYVAGSSRFDGAPTADPATSGAVLTWADGFDLAPGSTKELTYQVTFPDTEGTYTNRAVAHIGNEQIDTTLDTSDDAPATHDLMLFHWADLSLAKTVDNPAPVQHDSITFTLTLANGGPYDAAGVWVTDLLPDSLTFTGDVPSRGTYDNLTGLWDVGSLAAGDTVRLAITAVVEASTAVVVNTAEVTASSQADPDSTPGNGDVSEDDHDSVTVTPSGSSGGGDGGLESNGSLAQILARLFYARSRQPEPPALRFSPADAAAKQAAGSALPTLVPEVGPEGSRAHVVSPADLLPVTNATDVFAVDYLREADGRRLAVLFATETPSGTLYEHTKVVCDRLRGATLDAVRRVEVAGHPFILSQLRHADGSVDHALSFVVYKEAGRATVDSRFRLEEYTPPAGAHEVYNLQVWSVSRDYTVALARQVLDELAAQFTEVVFQNTAARPPVLPRVFIRSGRYEQGRLTLDVYNAAGARQLYLSGGTLSRVEGGDREQFEMTMALPEPGPGGAVEVDVPVGPFFDAAFFIETEAEAGTDQLYLADGAWSYAFDAEGATVSDFRVQPEAGELLSAGKWAVQRNVRLSGDVRTWAVAFRYLRSSAQPVDLRAFGTVEFRAWGRGQVRMLVEKASIRTSDHYSYIFKLDSEPRTYRIPFEQLRRSGGQGGFTAEDVVVVSFYVVGEQGRTRSFALNVEDVRFGGGPGDPLSQVPEAFDLAQNYPNPFAGSTQIGFGLPEAARVRLRVYDLLGREVAVVVDRDFDAGRHTVPFEAGRLSSGVYLYRLEAGDRTLARRMILVK